MVKLCGYSMNDAFSYTTIFVDNECGEDTFWTIPNSELTPLLQEIETKAGQTLKGIAKTLHYAGANKTDITDSMTPFMKDSKYKAKQLDIMFMLN